VGADLMSYNIHFMKHGQPHASFDFNLLHSRLYLPSESRFISRRGSVVARRLAVRQARVRFSARHLREVFPSELTSDEEMERGLDEWRRINV
jgi:hypothetical protein